MRQTGIEVIRPTTFSMWSVKPDVSGLIAKEKPSGAWEFTGQIFVEYYSEDHTYENYVDSGTFQEDHFVVQFGFKLVRQ